MRAGRHPFDRAVLGGGVIHYDTDVLDSVRVTSSVDSSGFDPLRGGGELGALMRAFDWSGTPLGAPEQWPTSLKTIVGVMLGSRFPMALFWGEGLVNLYNDAYRPILGDKHPDALGRNGREVWTEIWPIIGRQVASIFSGGPATWNEHLHLPMRRRGYLEDTWFTFSYSPVPDDAGGVGGMLITCQETTEQVQIERELQCLRELGSGLADARTAEQACRATASSLCIGPDVPWCRMYLIEDGGSTVREVAGRGLSDRDGEGTRGRTWALDDPDAPWPFAAAAAEGTIVTFPPKANGDRPVEAVCVPLVRRGAPHLDGFMVCGTNPRRPADARYLSFFGLAADQVVTALANLHAYQQERQRLEAIAVLDREVRAERNRLRMLLSQVPAIVNFFRGPDLVFDFAHPRAQLRLGSRPLTGRPLLEAVPESGPNGVAAMLRQVYDTGAPLEGREQHLRIDVDGSGKLTDTWWNFIYLPIRGKAGKVEGVMTFDVEVTDQVLGRRALEQSEQRYRSLFTNSTVPLWEEDWNGVVQLAARLERLGVKDLGAWLAEHPEEIGRFLGAVELLETNRASLELMGTGERSPERNRLDAFIVPRSWPQLAGVIVALVKGETSFRGECVLRTYSGEEREVIFDVSVVPGYERDLRRVVASLFDITDRKRAEEERIRLLHEAREAIRLRDDFLSVAGHELRTPLAALKLQLESLQRKATQPGGMPLTPELLARPSKSVDRLHHLIDELLDISRISSGRLQLEPEPMVISELVQEIVERFSDVALRSGTELRLQVEDRGEGTWDARRLDQVLANLLTNAIKYGPGMPVDVVLKGDADTVELSVRDQGIGIDREHQERIFERFERAVSSRNYGGLGLGLWIVKQIVEASGGTIEVESAVGKGATFRVRLPRQPV